MNNLLKYPRTPHLHWSQGRTSDDKTLKDMSCFHNKNLLITIKMDGECTTMTRDKIYARSLDSSNHPSRDWVKAFWSEFKHIIPDGWRICGENLYAKHSIHYKDLPSYFMGFSVWNEKNECLSWDETLDIFKMLGVIPVHELFRFTFNDQAMQKFHKLFEHLPEEQHEGYVIGNMGSFHYDNFEKNVAKYVRKDHIQTDSHWIHQEIIKIS